MGVRLGELLAGLDRVYPPERAESWDTGIGLTCGDPESVVDSVLLAVDANAATVAEAVDLGVDLLLTHHPLLFRPVQSVAADRPKGALIHRLITAGVAHVAAHTNADVAVDGVNDALARALELTELRPLRPTDTPGVGLGRVGVLGEPLRLAAFAEFVAARLPATVGGVRAAGDPDRRVRTVAVCGGAGDSELGRATDVGADVVVTSDLRHHAVDEHLATPGAAAVVEVAHWAGEWPWLAHAARLIQAIGAGTVVTTVSTRRTDPWTVHAASRSLPPPGP